MRYELVCDPIAKVLEEDLFLFLEQLECFGD